MNSYCMRPPLCLQNAGFSEADLPGEVQIFTQEEIQSATNNYDHAHVRDGGKHQI